MLKPLSAVDAQTLRDFFREANYTHQDLDTQRIALDFPSRRNLPMLLEATREPTLFNLILRWFLLDVPAPRQSAEELLPPPVLALLLECGLLVRDGDSLLADVMLTPLDGCWFAADTSARLEAHIPDLVIWPNPTSRLLNQFTIRQPFRTAMDLGTGCGIQAIFAAQHCGQVVATDLNPRATLFVQFNAWLNGVTNVESAAGDTFAPVAHRSFDLIVANPPFFVTPPSDNSAENSSDQIYCQNGMELDQYCRRIVREAPAHLNEGGYLQMLCEWVQVEGQPWQERIAEWVEGAGLDAWIFHNYTVEVDEYARERIPSITAATGAGIFARWMAYFAQRGVQRIHGGMVALRRRTGRNWVRIEDVPLNLNRPLGQAVLHAFASIDLLELRGSDEELLSACPRLSPDTQLDRRMRQAEGRWQVVESTLRFTDGIPATMRLDPPVADFLAALDGSRSLREVTLDLAQRVRADPAVVQRECLAVVRALLQRRFVLP